MLFNSYAFIFLFLIPAALVYRLIRPGFRIWFLVAASIAFYAQWDLGHLAILLGSIAVNFSFTRIKDSGRLGGSAYLPAIVTLNLTLLFYFKYSNFAGLTRHDLILPLAISFFTFQQIAFQVQFYRNEIQTPGLRDYLFFVLFFPQLIAGPIVQFRQLVSQIPTRHPDTFACIQNGILLFTMGLFKKVILADTLSPMADRAFAAAGSGLSAWDAWSGIFAYSFQIYFDFSGYADMAVGLGLIFGFRLPVNFNSPYKAASLIDFWRRWHMTLSAFLKTHIYIPLGGNRAGWPTQSAAIMATMLLGGMWHGAGWTFILWGGFHGLFLLLNHLLVRFSRPVPRWAGMVFTFCTVTLLWVFFRAESLTAARNVYEALFSFDLSDFHLTENPAAAIKSVMTWDLGLVGICFFLVWACPNSLDITRYTARPAGGMARPGIRFAWMAGLLLFCALKAMAAMPAKTFVYFNF